jgi:hypothetical protein
MILQRCHKKRLPDPGGEGIREPGKERRGSGTGQQAQKDMPLSLKLAGVVGGVVSLASLGSVVTLTGSLSGETFPPKSRAWTVKVYVVSGWSGPKLPDVSLTPCRTGLPFI